MAALARPIGSPFAQLVVAGGVGLVVYVLIAAAGGGRGRRAWRWVTSFVAARRGPPGMSRPSRSPLVSIALPVYNGADTVAPVVESVLAQTHADLELVISDNASTDGTEEICRQFARDDRRVVYQRQRDERRPAQQLHQRGGERSGDVPALDRRRRLRSSRTTSRGSSTCSRRTSAGSW